MLQRVLTMKINSIVEGFVNKLLVQLDPNLSKFRGCAYNSQ